MTEAEAKLARIAALCSEAERREVDFAKDIWPDRTVHNPQVYVSQLRAILDAND